MYRKLEWGDTFSYNRNGTELEHNIGNVIVAKYFAELRRNTLQYNPKL
jgi:hypothetical protein